MYIKKIQKLKKSAIRKFSKKYFHITFYLVLMCNRDNKDYKFLCVGVEFIAFNVSLHTKSEQIVNK